MKGTTSWFEVDRKGLAALQAGKPKSYVIRELVQNALDEDIKECIVSIRQSSGIGIISVEDDNPEGFLNLQDAYTLFRHTRKRGNPEQRGRFNLGEKQVFSICSEAVIETTKGTITFNEKGRHKGYKKRESGSKITVTLRMNRKEYEEMLKHIDLYLIPKGVKFSVNGKSLKYKESFKNFSARLATEISGEDNVLRRTARITKVDVYKAGEKSWLLEMGIPVCEIDCNYDINVQQKIPLSIDRETVPESYLKRLYAEVLNATYEDLKDEQSSEVWVRTAMSDKNVSTEAVKDMVNKRYGDKVVVANPFAPTSLDDAISHAYRVIRGSELSADEWDNIKRDNVIQSSTQAFGKSFVPAECLPNSEWTEGMKMTAVLAKKIAKHCLDINLKVEFLKSKATCAADYGNQTVRFNITRTGNKCYDKPTDMIGLIVHELGHEKGHHTEAPYHEALTKMANELVNVALEDPKWFKLG